MSFANADAVDLVANAAIGNGNGDAIAKITHSDGIQAATTPAVTAADNSNSVNGPAVVQVKHLPADFYTSFISDASKRRKPSPIRGLFPLEKIPGVISLLAGKPNPDTFPISNVQVTVRAPPSSDSDSASTSASAQSMTTTLDISGATLAAGLQYGSTAGYEPLVAWIGEMQAHAHGRRPGAVEGWRVSMGSGSQDLLYKSFHALINPGDSVLVESPVYSGILPILDDLRADIVPIQTDANGIQSSSLRDILEHWPASKPLPKFLYTVPYGCNPTGMTTSVERRREVLALSAKYNFIILEDDPYYYLYYGAAPRPPSFFTLERELEEVGRVLRLDSLSKVLSAGIRIGFASGPTPILDAIDLHTSTANLQVSSLTQVITLAVLESFGYDGFVRHTEGVSRFYREKRDVFEDAMRRHLDGLAEWSTPEAGMFMWFKLLLNDPTSSNHNASDAAAEEDSEELIRTKALANGVLALPGTSFLADGGKTAYVRASFSLASPDAVDEALRRLSEVVIRERASTRAGDVDGN